MVSPEVRLTLARLQALLHFSVWVRHTLKGLRPFEEELCQPSIELRPIVVNYLLKILSSGSLGSGVDEERSKLRVGM